MPSKKLLELHQMVHSLTKSERSAITQYAEIQGFADEKVYLQLFKALCKIDIWDTKQEQILKEKFKKVSQLSERCTYLYNIILKILRLNSTLTPRTQMNALMDNMEWLIEKGLYRQALKMTQKAKKWGYKYELFESLLFVVDYEKYLQNTLRLKKSSYKIPESQPQFLIEEIDKKYRLLELLRQLKILMHQKMNPNFDGNKDLNEIYKMQEVQPNFNSKSFRIKKIHNNILDIIGKINKEKQSNARAIAAAKELYLRYPEMKHFYWEYLSSLCQQLINVSYDGNFEPSEFLKKFNVLLALINKRNCPHNIAIFVRLTYSAVVRYWGIQQKNTNQIKNILVKYNRLFNQCSGILASIPQEVQLYKLYQSIAFAYLNNWKEAEESIKICLKEKSTIRKDIVIAARLIQLVILYELVGKVNRYLKSTARSLYLYLFKHHKELRLELQFCTIFTKTSVEDKIAESDLLDYLLILKQMKSINSEGFMKGIFDFEGWLRNQNTVKV